MTGIAEIEETMNFTGDIIDYNTDFWRVNLTNEIKEHYELGICN